MGEFRKYRPYYACNALRFNGYAWTNESGTKSNAITRVPNFKDIAGIEYGWLKNLNSSYTQSTVSQTTISGMSGQSVAYARSISNNYQTFVDLTPFATTDKLNDYDIDDYDYRPTMVGVTYFQRAMYVAQDVNKILYSMSIFNDTAEDIKVSCIKFRTCLGADSNSGRGYSAAAIKESTMVTGVYAILCAYFLDEEVTIHPGDSHLLSISFESSQF